ncbi:serine/threonine protein kinase [Actinopolymorpha pittospori]
MQGDFHVEGYDIEGLLGAGPAGEVWLAREQSSGAHAALKRVRPRDTDAQDEARRIVAALESLAHPHLVRIREMLPYGGELVFVLDYAEGGSLGQLLLARATLDPGEVVTVATALAGALDVLHRRGLTHADVTPENVLFTADARPLLADAGLLALVEGGESGTVGYTDPAGQDGSPASPAGDVYGLAAVCYTALTGAPPEPGYGHRPLHQVAPGVPSALAHIVEAGLQSKPNLRPSAAQFGAQLAAACPSAPVRFPSMPTTLGDSPSPFAGDLGTGSSSSFGEQDPFVIGGGGSAPERGSGPAPGPRSGAGPGPGPGLSPGPGPGPMGDPRSGGDPATSGLPAGFPGPPPSFPAPHQGVPSGGGDGRSARDDRDRDEGDDEETSRRPRLLLLAIGVPVLLVAVGVGGVIGWRAVRDDAPPDPTPTSQTRTTPSVPAPPPQPPVPSSTPRNAAEARWTAVLNQLDQKRAEAYRTWDQQVLGEVYKPGSDALGEDLDNMRDYAQQNVTSVVNLRTPILSLDVVSQSPERVVVDAVSQLQPYRLEIGGNLYPHDGGTAKRFRMTLEPNGSGGWLIAASRQIGPAPTEPAR